MEILDFLTAAYHSNLENHEDAIEYLHSRGLSDETINHFKLGYCDSDVGIPFWHEQANDCGQVIYFKYLNEDKNEISKEEMEFLHVLGVWRHRFENRITIPIFHNNTVVYMTSRAFPEQKVKHLHQHGKRTYAFNHDAIYTDNQIFITEGPFDCMTLHQNGFASIGLMGANIITHEIIEDLQRKQVYIVFDSEPNQAGKNASTKLANKLGKYGIESYIIYLSNGETKEDVNSFFLNHENALELFKELVLKAEKHEYIPSVRISRKYDNSLDVLTVASHYLEVRQSGSHYRAICPFHKDSEPSMVFYPNNTFYCFGCGKSGNAITLIRHMEKDKKNVISNKEAIGIGEKIVGKSS